MNRTWERTLRFSETGEARHEAILSGMKAVLRRRVRRRRAARALATGVAAVALVAGLSLMFRTRVAVPGSVPRAMIAAPTRGATAAGGLILQHAAFQVVETQSASALGRASITVLDDDQLLAELRALGMPSGLIRMRDTVVLTVDVGIKPGGSDEVPGRS